MKKTILGHASRRNWLINKFIELGFAKGAEIGTDRGHYAELLLSKMPGLDLSCIDPWTPYTEGKDVKTQEDMDKIFDQAMKRIDGKATVLIMTSKEALKAFEDESLDFVFIDGNHSYEFVKEDVENWSKKVKKGGIICGHDYKENKQANYGVIEAIDEYCEKNDIELFILHAGGTLVDCWMFYKK